MSSIVPGFECDVFISYRHNDNLDGWVTEFVLNLEKELKATIKERVSIYFDKNPNDGLLEMHQVDKSLEGKLRCFIFIPILSQTYCDPRSFAWQHEFCAFNQLAKSDALGRDVTLSNGNVASRILPIKIHDLDPEDKKIIETELDSALRAIEFIYNEPGVNRPLKPGDSKTDNQNKTDYRNQVNKVANAIKSLIYASHHQSGATVSRQSVPVLKSTRWRLVLAIMLLTVVSGMSLLVWRPANTPSQSEVDKILDRAERYFDEAVRFDDSRYYQHALEAIQKALAIDSLNERALYLMTIAFDTDNDTIDHFVKKILTHHPGSHYGLLARAGRYEQKNNHAKALEDVGKVLDADPNNKDALKLASVANYFSGHMLQAFELANRYEAVSGKGMHDIKSDLYINLGDFAAARKQLELKLREEELSCGDIETYQRIYLCEGNFEKLERLTDSVCAVTKCEKCPYWLMRAKMHVGKFAEATHYTKRALRNYGPIAWRYPAYVLDHAGKKDSADLLFQAEVKYSMGKLNDSTYHQAIPVYSLSSISAMNKQYEESIRWLRQYADRGFEMGSEWYIGHDPLFESLRSNPKYFTDFIQIVQKAQLRMRALR